MELGQVRPGINEFEHTIHEPGGIFGVKDGQKFPLTQDEWRKAHPLHRDTGCKECTFVADKAALLLYMVPREVRESATKEPRFIGKFTMVDWSGHSSCYIFKCAECSHTNVDYPHGYTGGGFMYLKCDQCKLKLVLGKTRHSEIYSRDGLYVPLLGLGGFVKAVKTVFRLRFSRKASRQNQPPVARKDSES